MRISMFSGFRRCSLLVRPARLAEWDAAGVEPGADGLLCQGNCQCQLVPTDEPSGGAVVAGPLRKNTLVDNSGQRSEASGQRTAGDSAHEIRETTRNGDALANTGWTDEARVASLAVRQAKVKLHGSRDDRARARQQESMDKAGRDYEGIYKEKGYAGMTQEERTYLSARIAVKVPNGTVLSDAEQRYLKESQSAGAPRTLATTNRYIRAAKERVRAARG